MGRTARCPSCGAPVEFKSVASVLAVCGYCQSTLLREGAELAKLGRMAELIEDRSPLQRGAEGRWKGRHFGSRGCGTSGICSSMTARAAGCRSPAANT